MTLTDEKGFILLETLLSLVLAGIVTAGLFAVHWLVFRAFEQETALSDLQYSIRQAKDFIIEDCKYSKSITVLESPGGKETPEGNCLHLIKDFEVIDYYASNKQLYRDSNTSSPLPVAENIEGITLTNLGLELVEIQIKASTAGENFTLQTSVKSRLDW